MNLRNFLGGVLGFWLLAIAAGSAPAQIPYTRVFHVNNGSDSGPGSFRQALADANAAEAPGITLYIRFDTPDLAVNLNSGLSIQAPVTIDGQGATINGGGTVSGAGLNIVGSHVWVENITVQGFGIGIQVSGQDTELIRCNARQNSTDGFSIPDTNPDVYVRMIGGEASNNGRYGINFINSGGSIYAVHVFGNHDDGINLVGCKSTYIGPDRDVVPVVGDLGGHVDEIMAVGPARARAKNSLTPGRSGPPAGTDPLTCLIHNNGGYGINLTNHCINTTIYGCYIGTDGTNAQPNAAGGVSITDSTGTHVSHCLVSGNGTNWAPGIILYSTQSPSTCRSNSVTDCYIGTDITGTHLVPNSGYGIYLYNAADNFIGPTPTALSRTAPTLGANVITGNIYDEVNIGGTDSPGNHVQGNILGLDATATVPLDSSVGGVSVSSSPGNFIEGNLISTHANGIDIAFGNNAVIRNNRIAVRGTYSKAISLSEANNCLIGGPNWDDGNFLSCDDNNNGAAAWVYHVNVPGFVATNNTIRGNATFGPIVLDGDRTANVPCGSTNGANLLLNYPVLTAAVTAGGVTTISGTLNSLKATTYALDFYANTNSNLQAPSGQSYLGSLPVTTDAGCTGSFQFVVSAPAPVPAGQFITATATDPTGNTSEFSAPQAVTGTAATADVSLTATVTPTLVEPGGSVTFSLVLSNAGPGDAGPVTVTNWLPAEVTFVSCNATGGGNCGGSGNNRTVSFSSLASGTTATITFVATVSSALTNGTELDNFAVANLTTPDPNPANNTAVAVALAERQADLMLTQTPAPEPVNAGAELTYSLVVSNQGPDTATRVQLVDRLPSFAAFVSVVASQGSCTQLGNVVSCSLSNLAAGSSATVTLTVVPVLTGLVTNTAVVVVNELDENLSNNIATAISTVLTGVAPAQGTITVVPQPSNGGTVSGGGTYPAGSSHSITATANTGWTFTGWNDSNAQNPRTIIVPAGGASYTASFSIAGATVAMPIITPEGGEFTNSQTVTLRATPGVKIYYTTNGMAPTSSSSAYKNKAITLTNSVTVKAIAFKGSAASPIATATFTIIQVPLKITTTNLTNGVVGALYTSGTLHAIGGIGTYKWSLAAGSKLPTGLKLTPAGVITGTPTKATVTATGSSSPAIFTVKVTDSRKNTYPQQLSLMITAN